MTKHTKYYLGIEIDKLTNSIQNTISGDSFPTDVHPLTRGDFKNITLKTKLIEHYEKTLGATHVGGHKMVIFPPEALKLIRKYFPT